MATSNLPNYVERSDNKVLPAPADLEHVTLYVFPVPSKVMSQQSLCDKFLNDPSNGECDYRAFLNHVFLIYANVGALRPEYPDKYRGYFTYLECGFWVPVISMHNFGGVDIGWHLAMYPHYMFVDESSAMAAGREMQGWGKELAQEICVAGQKHASGLPGRWDLRRPEAREFSLKIAAAGEDGTTLLKLNRRSDRIGGSILDVGLAVGQEALEGLRRVIRADNPEKERLPGLAWSMFEGAKQMILGDGRVSLPSPMSLRSLALAASASGLTFALLKQFPDAKYPNIACYQAGIEAEVKVTKHRGWGLLGKYQLSVESLESHPFVSDFGLGDGEEKNGAQVINDIQGFFVEMDLRLEKGRELWCHTRR